MSYTETFTWQPCVCPVCGVFYSLPEPYYEIRRRDGQAWHCPNGHRVMIAPVNRGPSLEERQAMIRKIHGEEQEEARRAHSGESIPWGEMANFLRDGRYHCPICRRQYKTATRFGEHVRHDHGIEPCTGARVEYQ